MPAPVRPPAAYAGSTIGRAASGVVPSLPHPMLLASHHRLTRPVRALAHILVGCAVVPLLAVAAEPRVRDGTPPRTSDRRRDRDPALARDRRPGEVRRVPGGIVLGLARGALRVTFHAPDVVHVTLAPTDRVATRPSLVVLPASAPVTPGVVEGPDVIVVRTDAARVRVQRATGALTVEDRAGRVLVRAAAPGSDAFAPVRDTLATADGPAWAVRQRFVLTPDEGLYGLGQYQDGVMNYRGEQVLIAQANTSAAIPFLLSTRGYGVLWDNYSLTVFDNAHAATAASRDTASLSSDVADGIDYYVVAGRRPEDAVAGYRRLTGAAPMYPRWAYGYWQSKEHYDTQQELLDVAAEYRRRRIPVDVIVQDWSYWGGPDQFSGMVWDPVRYPDPAGMARRLHADHFHVVAVVWPALGDSTAVGRDMAARGFLYPRAHWAPAHVYDAYDPRARDLYWAYAKRGVWDVGLDAWWMDATEPEFRSTDDRYVTAGSIVANGRNALGTFARYLNPYALLTTRGVYEHQRALTDEQRVVILTRSAFAGQQRYATTLWSGDIWSSWGVFRDQIPAGLNAGMAGLPYWTTDVGGFISSHRFPGGVADPAFRELYVRWFQFGAFCPIFRAHGSNTPREVWQFGGPGDWAYDALVAADSLRYRLLPYVYSLAHEVSAGGTMMRALPLAFPGDRRGYGVGGEFMFGPALLVSPVTRPMLYPPARAQEWIPARDLYAPDGRTRGVRLDFFQGAGRNPFVRDSLAATRPAEVFNLTWAGALPESLATRPYSARYSGVLRADETGRYEFVLTTDGGVRLWLGDSLVVDRWDNRDALEVRPAVRLDAGSAHPLRLEYREARRGASRLLLEWITPTTRARLRPDPNWATYLPGDAADGTTPDEGTNAGWYDFWTGERLAAGRPAVRPAPIARVPLYVRAGSVVPMGPALQYADEGAADPIELRVYPGADGAFTLYDDEGDSYRYERGASATIPIAWNEAARTLTIGPRVGRFPGMRERRTLHVVFVRRGHGVGLPATTVADAVVPFDGRAVVVRR